MNPTRSTVIKVSIGRIVHIDTVDGCRPAIVFKVYEDGSVGVQVFGDNVALSPLHVFGDAASSPHILTTMVEKGSEKSASAHPFWYWHWPERED